MTRPFATRHAVVKGILFGILGFAANWFKLELFFNVDFIFGSIFVLLAIARLGNPAGLTAGLIAGSCTILLWHHPWALVIGIAEAIFVAVALRRHNISLLAADMLFWLLCGMPLVWLFYHHVMAIPAASCQLVALKQSLNGISNAALAQTILLATQAYRSEPGRLPRFRQLIFTVIVALVLFVGMLMLVSNLRGIMRRQMLELTNDTGHTARIAASTINAWMQQQLQSVTALAQLVGDPSGKSPAELQHLVESANIVITAFSWMGVMDQTSRSIAYDPPFDENGHSNVGTDYSDRPYIPILRETRKPYIADLLTGKIGNHSPRALMIAPLVPHDRYCGFCVGVTDLQLVRHLLQSLIGHHAMHITLVDRKGQVVASTKENFATMKPLDYVGEHRQIRPDIFHWIPPTPPRSSIMQRWRESRIIAEQQLDKDFSWKVVVETSPNALLDTLTNESISGMAQLLAIILSSAVTASLLGRIFLKPLDDLRRITEELPGLIPATLPEKRWPVSRMYEIDVLSSNFQRMAILLSDKFSQQETTFRQLARETEKRQQLERQMVHLREQVERGERSRISRELHDGLGQSLQAVKLNLQVMQARCANGCGGVWINDVIAEIGATSEELRDLVAMLRPPVLADQNLPEALHGLAERLSRRSGVEFKITSSSIPEELSDDVKSGGFRICQEACSNALRHGRPTIVEIHMTCSRKRLTLRIYDNGSGFDPLSHRSGSGIDIMNERATLLGGTFKLHSSPGNGTTITVEVALP